MRAFISLYVPNNYCHSTERISVIYEKNLSYLDFYDVGCRVHGTIMCSVRTHLI